MNKKQSSENLITLANYKSYNYFYGKINNNRYLNCALYPFSPPSEICPDWRQRSISRFLLELSFFDSPAIAKMQQQLNTNRKLGLISQKIFLKQETLMIKVFKKKYPLKKKYYQIS